jgi:hypothetical protein
MPSPSAIAVWVRPLALRMRLMRGPANIFWSAIGLTEIHSDRTPMGFTYFTDLQNQVVKGNTSFPHFQAHFSAFSGLFCTAM